MKTFKCTDCGHTDVVEAFVRHPETYSSKTNERNTGCYCPKCFRSFEKTEDGLLEEV